MTGQKARAEEPISGPVKPAEDRDHRLLRGYLIGLQPMSSPLTVV